MRDVTHVESTTKDLHIGSQRLRVMVGQGGAGRPLLLINGIGATGQLFRPFTQHLADRESIAFDAPGVGGSPAPFYPPTIRRLAGVVAGLVHDLGHQQVDVLGLSWGGTLAQELAHRHPDVVRRLVLAATMSGWTSLPGRPLAVATLMSPLRYYSPAYLERVAPTLYGGAIRKHPQLLHEHAQIRASHPPTLIGYTQQLAALRRWTSFCWLPRLTQRTLVLAGDDDPIVPLANARLLANRIPHSHLQIIHNGGHLFVFTHAQEIAAAVREFLDAEQVAP